MTIFYNKSKNEFRIVLFYVVTFCFFLALGIAYLAPLTFITKNEANVFTVICFLLVIFYYFQAND